MGTLSTNWLDELRKGLALTRDAEHDAALACFERAYEQAPERSETACALGREHMRRGESDRACELLLQAWDSDPGLFSAGTSLSRCLGLHMHEWERAHAVLDDVDCKHGPSEDSRLIRGELLLAQGRHDEAAVLAEPLRQSEIDSIAQGATLLVSRVENARGLRSARKRAYEQAIFAFKRAGDLDPGWAAPLSNMGAAFQELGKYQRAQAAYRDALLLDPRYARAWHNLATLYRKRGDRRALDSFERAFLSAPEQSEMAVDYALALLEREAPELADEALLTHISETQDDAEAWVKVAMPLLACGAWVLAKRSLLRAYDRCRDETMRARVEALLEGWQRSIQAESGDEL